MSLIAFVWFCMATIGLTNIIVHGAIMDEIKIRKKSLREWLHSWEFTEKLSSCYECSGFWSGVVCGCFFLPLGWSLLLLPVCGFAGSFLGKTYTDLMFYVESKTDLVIGGNNADETRDN